MSGTPGLGAFNKDKVANKFGIQLKPKDATQRSSTENKANTTSTVTKNKTIGDFRTDKSTNGFLTNTNRMTTSKTPESTRKIIEKTPTSKSTSKLVNTSVNTNQQSTSLTSTVNHSTAKSKESLTAKSPATTKRPSVGTNERAISPAPPIKRPSVPKTEAQILFQNDQPLYKRQSSKQLDNSSPTTTTTTTTTPSTTSLKR